MTGLEHCKQAGQFKIQRLHTILPSNTVKLNTSIKYSDKTNHIYRTFSRKNEFPAKYFVLLKKYVLPSMTKHTSEPVINTKRLPQEFETHDPY